MRSLTLKLPFAGDVKKRNKDRLGLKSQPQGRRIKREECEKIILHSDKILFTMNIPD